MALSVPPRQTATVFTTSAPVIERTTSMASSGPFEQVVVEGGVAHRRVRVAVADGEARVAVADRPLHQAALGRQVHDVVLVDPRRAEQQRDLVDELGAAARTGAARTARCGRRPCRACRPCSRPRRTACGRPARASRRWSRRSRHHVLGAADEAQPAGLEGPLQGGRVAEQGVGRGQGVGQDGGRQGRLGAGVALDRGGVDDLADEALAAAGGAAGGTSRRRSAPRRVGEPGVTAGGDGTVDLPTEGPRHCGGPGRDHSAHQLPGGVGHPQRTLDQRPGRGAGQRLHEQAGDLHVHGRLGLRRGVDHAAAAGRRRSASPAPGAGTGRTRRSLGVRPRAAFLSTGAR